MANLTTFKHSKTHRVVLFGAPKTGKTQLVGDLSKYFKMKWLDLENGFETLLKLPQKYQENIDLIRIPDSKVYPIAIETMLKVINGSKVNICDLHGKVSCSLCKKDNLPFTEVCLNDVQEDEIVVVDSLTQLANSAMNNITRNQPDDYKVEWEDYRKQGALMDKFLSQVQQAKYNIVCISHEAEVEMEDGRKKLVPVSGTTNFSRNTAKYFDHVIYSQVKNMSHKFGSSTTYSNNILTGSRTDVTMESTEQPSLLSIFRPTGSVASKDGSKLSTGSGTTNASTVSETTGTGNTSSSSTVSDTALDNPPAVNAAMNMQEKLAALRAGKK